MRSIVALHVHYAFGTFLSRPLQNTDNVKSPILRILENVNHGAIFSSFYLKLNVVLIISPREDRLTPIDTLNTCR